MALAMTLLRNGELDMVVAGGYDPISEYAYAGFNSLRLVAESPLRPFCEGREGMKVSEGYGIVVLERAGDAQRRCVQPLAEVRAFGESADVHHLTQPNPEGEGASRAIVAALEAADLTVADIGLISAHATGTPDNDSSEAAALRDAFGDRLRDVPLVAFKSHLGHTLGGAGAVELILSAMAMRDGKVPPTANVTPEAIAYDDLAIHTETTAKDASIAATLNLSLGFGGANTAVILTPPRRVEESLNVITVDKTKGVNTRSVGVTGVGVVMGGAVGNDAFIERLGCETAFDLDTVRSVDRDALAGLIHARR
ncbi:MAG: beta-ketoacyl synthase N-terminal-like domain-containing protein, partial [Phycisphaeraceae bacterium]